jgi:hypothetical protein
MTPVEEANQILHDKYGWPSDLNLSAGATELYLSQGHTPEEAAATADEFCWERGDSVVPPFGFTGSGYEWIRYDYNHVSEYWDRNTQVELGVGGEDAPVDKVTGAQSVSEWFSLIDKNRTRQGYILLDETPEGKAEMERRREKANFIPPEWSSIGKADIWRLAVLEGYIKTTLDAFSAAYAANTPSLDSVRKLDTQQWLDNLRCDDKGKPRKWNSDGTPNPKFAGF